MSHFYHAVAIFVQTFVPTIAIIINMIDTLSNTLASSPSHFVRAVSTVASPPSHFIRVIIAVVHVVLTHRPPGCKHHPHLPLCSQSRTFVRVIVVVATTVNPITISANQQSV
jgi:hypothetical protein